MDENKIDEPTNNDSSDLNNSQDEELQYPFEEQFDSDQIIESKSNIEKVESLSQSLNKNPRENKSMGQSDNSSHLFNEILGTADNVEAFLRESDIFKDFLELPKISGITTGMPEGNYYPKEILIERNDSVDIEDSLNIDRGHERTTVVSNKDSDGNIISIDIFCKCGERTTITLDFDDSV